MARLTTVPQSGDDTATVINKPSDIQALYPVVTPETYHIFFEAIQERDRLVQQRDELLQEKEDNDVAFLKFMKGELTKQRDIFKAKQVEMDKELSTLREKVTNLTSENNNLRDELLDALRSGAQPRMTLDHRPPPLHHIPPPFDSSTPSPPPTIPLPSTSGRHTNSDRLAPSSPRTVSSIVAPVGRLSTSKSVMSAFSDTSSIGSKAPGPHELDGTDSNSKHGSTSTSGGSKWLGRMQKKVQQELQAVRHGDVTERATRGR